MSTLSDTYFAQAFAAPPARPVEIVERDRAAAHEQHMAAAIEQRRRGSLMLAYYEAVRATEAEFKITGPSSVRLPVMDVLRRLPAKRVRTAVS